MPMQYFFYHVGFCTRKLGQHRQEMLDSITHVHIVGFSGNGIQCVGFNIAPQHPHVVVYSLQ